MKLESLSLSNFRRFNSLDITFHPELTVLSAQNGQGKTTILDAATIALGTFIGAFDLGRSRSIAARDARFLRLEHQSDLEQAFPVTLQAMLKGFAQPVIRELNSAKGKTTIKGASELTKLGKQLMSQLSGPVSLPLLAYYGSGRLWNTHKNMSRKSVLSNTRTMGYEDCFSSASSFTQVQQWMTKATFAALQQQGMEAYQGYKITDQIQGIQNTVDAVLQSEGWSGFHYSVQHEELAMSHQELGILPVSILSDGVRAMVSLVADMAWRCTKLNPHMGAEAPLKTEGIVFIDEVDMFLHPAWQQTVIKTLREAFPNVQFIVTTHSPQLLSTVHRENIRIIQNLPDGEAIAQSPSARTYGEPSGDVLHAAMFVDPQPPVPEKKDLQALTERVDQGLYDDPKVTSLMAELSSALGEEHPQLQRLKRSINRQRILNG